MAERTYLSIDLKSFYASVECVERGMDPLTTNLLVADTSRTDKTICLAVSPALKTFGLPGRVRLYEAKARVDEANRLRGAIARKAGKPVRASSFFLPALEKDPFLAVDFIVAPPRMAHYIDFSARIYQIYLKYIAPEDIVVYSIDEVFMDVTDYLDHYKLTAEDLAMRMVRDVLDTTGITATAGIGPNLFLAKIAMDLEAKKMPADENGVRMARLDVASYREHYWDHRPITDFWRVGKGTAQRLAKYGLHTMGDIALCSVGEPGHAYNEDLLYDLFGVNAELLIDHAWGYESCRISDIKAYVPQSKSLSRGQVLSTPYPFDKARLVMREMADLLALDLVAKGLVTDQVSLTVGYDVVNLRDPHLAKAYPRDVTKDMYGRRLPKEAHKSLPLGMETAASSVIMEALTRIFDQVVDPRLYIRRLYVVADRVMAGGKVRKDQAAQLNFFGQMDEAGDGGPGGRSGEEAPKKDLDKERRVQEALVEIKRKYGKNAVLRGMNLEEGATAKDRNDRIGGHKA